MAYIILGRDEEDWMSKKYLIEADESQYRIIVSSSKAGIGFWIQSNDFFLDIAKNGNINTYLNRKRVDLEIFEAIIDLTGINLKPKVVEYQVNLIKEAFEVLKTYNEYDRLKLFFKGMLGEISTPLIVIPGKKSEDYLPSIAMNNLLIYNESCKEDMFVELIKEGINQLQEIVKSQNI